MINCTIYVISFSVNQECLLLLFTFKCDNFTFYVALWNSLPDNVKLAGSLIIILFISYIRVRQ